MKEFYKNLNQRIYENCMMSYNSFKDKELLEKDRGLALGAYMAINIVANDYVMNYGKENKTFRDLANKLEEIVIQG